MAWPKFTQNQKNFQRLHCTYVTYVWYKNNICTVISSFNNTYSTNNIQNVSYKLWRVFAIKV